MSGYRLSVQQKRIWLAQQQRVVLPAVQCRVRIGGANDRVALQCTASDLVRRHEILRTVFERRAGLRYPLQIVRDFDVASRDEESPFQIELIEDSGGPVLALTAPALCADRATLVAAAAAILGRCVDAPEPVQYADYAAWQEAYRADGSSESGRAHWLEKRCHPGHAVSLGCESGEPDRRGYGTVALELNADRLLSLSGTSLERILLACWQILLWRLSGRCELLVGIAFDGRRTDPQLATAMGPYETWLPLTSEIDPDARLGDFIGLVDREYEAAAVHHASFDWEEHTEPPHIFPFSFRFDDTVGPTVLQCSPPAEPFKLLLVCTRRGPSITAEFHYCETFARGDIESIAMQFRVLVGQLPSDDIALSKLRVLDQRECDSAIAMASAPAPESRTGCVTSEFERCAALAPHLCAAVCEGESLSYGELNRRANRLAHHLRRLGAGPETTCLLCLDRSLDFVIGMLGILKAGAAYVPAEPSWPLPRLQAIAAAARVAIVVTSERFRPEIDSVPIVCLDSELRLTAEADANPPRTAGPENAAYVIFTSGSSGRPKGVAVEHRQLSRYVTAAIAKLELRPQWTYAAVSSLAADLANTVIFPCLASGGTLHIVPSRIAGHAGDFATYMMRNQIDVLKIVPSHLAALLTGDSDRSWFPRRRLILGGERVPWEWMDRILRMRPECTIFNHYGPTETTIGAAAFRLGEAARDLRCLSVPIGHALPGASVHVLDSEMRPAPEWAPGEVYIGGGGVARGYVGEPELTAERFLGDPFVPGGRVFRTGDRARRLPGGYIEFLGRGDDQIKIRGYRVEPAEITSALLGLPWVVHAAVLPSPVEPGNPAGGLRLVAYVVPERRADSRNPEDVREALRRTLPEFMVPSAVVFLNELPVTANGKLDPGRLPAPEAEHSGASAVSPRTSVERRIAAIWTEVLGTTELGVHDNFFAVGGDSLSAMRVISRLQQSLGAEVALEAFFDAPTIAELAMRFSYLRTAEDEPQIKELRVEYQ